MTSRKAIATCALVGLIASLPLSAAAQDGDYVFDVSTPSAQAKVDKKIDAFVDEQAFYIRPFARGKLKESNKVCKKLVFTIKGDDVSYQCDGRETYTSPANGKLVKVPGKDLKLSQKVETKNDIVTITQLFKSEDGQRRTVFVYNPNSKKLKSQVKITGEKVKGALVYVVHYKQK